MTQDISIPVLDCRKCGACCTDIGGPPYIMQEILELPAAIQDRVLKAIPGQKIGMPCAFYNQNERECTIYLYRPMTCKAFIVGDKPCLGYRKRLNIDNGRDSLSDNH